MMKAVATHPYADNDARWQAVLDRDAAAEGIFYYGVRSTGVYCRPTCPSRRPRWENAVFFETTEDARRAGFRSCLRCCPDEVTSQQQVVAEVQRLLDSVDPSPSLRDLGAAVGFSPFHLQRLFKRSTGLSPKQYATSQRAERLKEQLKNGATVTSATYEAGYASSRAVYETARDELGMNPSTYRAGGQGAQICYALLESPLGRMLVAATDKGVCAVKFGEDTDLVSQLQAEFPRAGLSLDDTAVASHTRAVLDHLAGRQAHLDLTLDVRGTAFQERVWAALREIPYGQTRSYSDVARMIGEPNAVRAVARACATNPVALAVPCHRVVRASGEISGYRWGRERKTKLLDQERALAATPAPNATIAAASREYSRI